MRIVMNTSVFVRKWWTFVGALREPVVPVLDRAFEHLVGRYCVVVRQRERQSFRSYNHGMRHISDALLTLVADVVVVLLNVAENEVHLLVSLLHADLADRRPIFDIRFLC